MRVHRIKGLMASSYLIETAESLFLVDAGFVGHARRILGRIRSIGRRPEDLRLALITHAHLDHFGGLAGLHDSATFEIGCHPSHVGTIAEGGAIVSPGIRPWSRAYMAFARALLPRMRFRGAEPVVGLCDGAPLHSLGLPGRVVHTPGHSEGCLSVVLDDGTAIVGDLVHGKRLFVPCPELPAMAADTERTYASWGKLLEAGAKRVMPAHGDPFSSVELATAMRRRRLPLSAGVRA